MNEGMGKEHVVSFEEFLHELQKEWRFHQQGGTSYRQKTAELSLEVANKVGAVAPFLEREVAKQTVSRLLPGLDRYRLEDVAKMLCVVAKELHMNATLSDEVKTYLQQKKGNNKIRHR
ncbi:hypothetical protein [Bacillus smithii]|uniref:hypothetical protein n=1 Tax=Bacillus smithii TaxID=1479 RepID=UPI002E1DCAD1|nr:hypothetical protein [Bacillus smithii]MED1456393.1 hypothetical protein [Bacillus smithii]